MRTNDAELAARLREVLSAHVVPDVEAPPNLSLFVGADEGPRHEFHHLYRGGVPALRTRSAGRLLRAAVAHLDAYDVEPARTLRLDGRVLVRDGLAVVVDPVLGLTLDRVGRRLEQLGYRFVDVAGVPLDRERLDVALWPPRLELDDAALAAIDREYPPGEDEVDRAPALLPVRALVLWPPRPEDDGSPARSLASVAGLVARADSLNVTPADLALARRLMAGWDVRTCPAEDKPLLTLLGELKRP